MTPARVRLLGEPRVFLPDARPVRLPTLKTLATFAMILSAGDDGVSRQHLGERLWSRSSGQQARTNLRQALAALRKSLGEIGADLKSDGEILRFSRQNTNVDIDLLEVGDERMDQRRLDAHLDAGCFLEGVALKEPGFDAWLTEKRRHFDQLLQDRLERECASRLDDQDFAEAERISRKLITLDAYNETAHRARMRALHGRGETGTALKHFEDLAALLKSELEVAPSAATLELARRLRSVEELPQPRGLPPAKAKPAEKTSDMYFEPPATAGARPEATVSELRNVVVIAIDIEGEALDDVTASSRFDEIREASETVSNLLRSYVGTELSNDGYSVTAVFGYPKAHSKVGEHGLRFATAARSEIASRLPDAAIRIAIVSGVILADPAEGRRVLGDPTRRAQVQLQRTPDSRISTDRGIYHATRDLAEFVRLDDGIWSLVSLCADDATLDRADFVGRKRELRQATDVLEDVAADSRGEVIVLRGEAGIGKTRTSGEIAAAAARAGYCVASCRVLDFGQGRAANSPGMIARAIGVGEPPGLNRFERAVWADLADEAVDDSDRQLLLDMDRNSLLAEQSRILARLAEMAATERPTLLIVEDVHWANETLMEALARLAAAIEGLRFALLCTTRPEGDPFSRAWRLHAGNTKTTTLDLRALRHEAAVQLARNLRDLDNEVLEQCLERAGGNPLFIEQLVLWAEDRTGSSLPLSVQSVVQERLDQLPQSTRRMAQAAAILGQVFHADALAAVYGQAIGAARELEEAHLAVRGEESFSFVHALVRDGTYASIAPTERERLHVVAADWFAATDRVLSARHHYWAESPEACIVCSGAAETEHCAGRLDTALELSRFALERCRDPADRQKLEVFTGEILRDLERFEEAIACFAEIESADEDIALRALVGAAECHFRLDNQEETVRLLDEACKLELAATDATWATAIACHRSGVAFSRGDLALSMSLADTAMRSSEAADDMRLRARVLSTLADAEMVGGLFRSSERHFRECVQVCRENGLQRYGLTNQTIVSMLRFYDADLAEASRLMTEALDEARAINFLRAQMNGEHMLAYYRCTDGDFEGAERHWRRARDIIETTSAKRFVMNSGCYAAMIMGPLGRTEEALHYLHQAEEAAAELGLVWILPWVLASKAQWLEDRDAATRALDEAENLVFAGKAAYPFEFFYFGIEAAIGLSDWSRVEAYVQGLEHYFAKEPVALPTFVAARARAISAAERGEGRPDDIRALLATVDHIGFITLRPRLAKALSRIEEQG